jgi:hypothetical protein
LNALLAEQVDAAASNTAGFGRDRSNRSEGTMMRAWRNWKTHRA